MRVSYQSADQALEVTKLRVHIFCVCMYTFMFEGTKKHLTDSLPPAPGVPTSEPGVVWYAYNHSLGK